MPNDLTIHLRAVEPEDWSFMYEAERDPAAEEYSAQNAPLSKELLKQYALTYDADPFRSGQLRLIIEDKEKNPIGIADIYDISPRHARAECGIYIIPSERRKGYAKETLMRVIQLASSNLGLKQLTATISEDNAAALSVYRSVGFIQTGTRPKWWRNSSGFHDVKILNVEL